MRLTTYDVFILPRLPWV